MKRRDDIDLTRWVHEKRFDLQYMICPYCEGRGVVPAEDCYSTENFGRLDKLFAPCGLCNCAGILQRRDTRPGIPKRALSGMKCPLCLSIVIETSSAINGMTVFCCSDKCCWQGER